ncbi:MAG TPA: hypothetical protein VFF13_07020 [archaeon]|nr:hypothetical protein [archaeon]
MEMEFSENEIIFNRELSQLDELVLKFVKILDELKVDYVIISGYIAILFGRSRNTEDVDLFIEEMHFKKFTEMWKALERNGFECINAENPESAYNEYLKEKLAIRFAEKGKFIPNFELKFPKTDMSQYSLRNKITVKLNGENLLTSKIEPQIAYKLYMGSDKDIEDAAHLWETFKGKINPIIFNKFTKKLGVENKVKLLD